MGSERCFKMIQNSHSLSLCGRARLALVLAGIGEVDREMTP